MSKTISLKKVAKYSEARIPIKDVTINNFVTTDNLLQNKLGITKATSLPPQDGNMTAYFKNDILIGNIRPYLKKIWFADKDGGNSADVLTIKVNEKHNPKFIYYALYRDDFFEHMMKGSKGTKMPRGDKNQIMDFSIPDISLESEEKIANVLSSLDSKIELNNKINKELETMAKTLYDYWFVQFDFPDENGKPYKSSGGKMVYNQELKREIPEGWEVENLALSTLTTIIIPKIEKFDFEKIYLSTSEVDKTKIINHEQKITFKDRPSRANMQPIKNSIWFARMKNTKKLILVGEYSKEIIDKYIFSTGFAGLSVRDNALCYVWNTINNDGFEDIKDTLATGSTQKAVTNEAISNIKLLVPNENILNQYTHLLSPFFKKIYANEQQNQELAKLRDWLLPMLMNGQVRVK